MKFDNIDIRLNIGRLGFGLRIHAPGSRGWKWSWENCDLRHITKKWCMPQFRKDVKRYFQINPHLWLLEPNVYLSCVDEKSSDFSVSIDFVGRFRRSYRFHPFWKKTQTGWLSRGYYRRSAASYNKHPFELVILFRRPSP